MVLIRFIAHFLLWRMHGNRNQQGGVVRGGEGERGGGGHQIELLYLIEPSERLYFLCE